MGNSVRFSAYMDDHVTGTLGKMRDKFDTVSGSKGFKAIAQGVGLGIGAAAFGLLGSAIGGVTSFLGDSITAYNEEQKSVAKLDASLRANVAGYNGNRAAIEKVLTARMALGFSDEEQRDSLARLVAATHDENKALDIQRTAMDLARLKGISLSDATDALTKVEAGSFRILKSLGIVLKDGATQTDALAAVQRIATGQAEAYANTNEGKVLVAQIKVNEAQEKFGKALAKLEAEILPILADAIGGVADAFDSLGIGAEKSMADVEKAAANGNIAAKGRLEAMRRNMDETTTRIRDDLESKRGAIGLAAANAAQPIVDKFANAGRMTEREIKALPGLLAFDLRAGYDNIASASHALGEAMKNPIKLAAREKALQDILHGKGSVGRQLLAGLNSSDPLVHQAAITMKNHVVAELNALRNIKLTVKLGVDYLGGTGPNRRMLAKGGFVPPGGEAYVGEDGWEKIVARRDGGVDVIPLKTASASASRPSSAGGWGGVMQPHSHPIYMDGKLVAEAVGEHQYRELRRAAPSGGRV